MNAELFAAIESPDLSAQLNVVSGYKQFSRALASSPQVQALLVEARSSGGSGELIPRIRALLRAECDPACETPHDVALAAYLWVLWQLDPGAAASLAKAVQAAGGWWSRKLAEQLMTDGPSKPDNPCAATASFRQGSVFIGSPPFVAASGSACTYLASLNQNFFGGESTPVPLPVHRIELIHA
jgi:hypothetical protein